MAFWMKKIANVYLTLTHMSLTIAPSGQVLYNISSIVYYTQPLIMLSLSSLWLCYVLRSGAVVDNTLAATVVEPRKYYPQRRPHHTHHTIRFSIL